MDKIFESVSDFDCVVLKCPFHPAHARVSPKVDSTIDARSVSIGPTGYWSQASDGEGDLASSG
jgi:hypothetical protein